MGFLFEVMGKLNVAATRKRRVILYSTLAATDPDLDDVITLQEEDRSFAGLIDGDQVSEKVQYFLPAATTCLGAQA